MRSLKRRRAPLSPRAPQPGRRNSDLPPGPAGTFVTASHKVRDPDVRLAAWSGEERRKQFAAHGAPTVRVFQDPETPGMTGLLIDVVDMEAFQAYLAS